MVVETSLSVRQLHFGKEVILHFIQNIVPVQRYPPKMLKTLGKSQLRGALVLKIQAESHTI